MKISGIIDFSLGNILCIRGFAQMGDLYRMSTPVPEIQRNLIEDHKGEMAKFLRDGKFSFFPEVILSMTLSPNNNITEDIENLYDSIREGTSLKSTKINNIKIKTTVKKTRSTNEARVSDKLTTAYIDIEETEENKFFRIDGNHRLSATEEDEEFKLINTPFCLIIFKNEIESRKLIRAIFHNINYKQIPLTMEQNLQLIINSDELFSDDILKEDPSFGYNYYLARKIYKDNIDFGYVPKIKRFIEGAQCTFLVEEIKLLLDEKLLEKNDDAIDQFKHVLTQLNSVIENCEFMENNNIAIVGALAYYKFKDENQFNSFVQWIEKNNIGLIKNLHINDVINIFDKVYENIPKKVFLARWYPPESKVMDFKSANYRLEALRELVEDDLGLKLIDLGSEIGGTYHIHTKMFDDIKNSDIFIADLTGNRHNVMIEFGYALKHIGTGRMLLYFQPTEECPTVPFDTNDFRYECISEAAEIKMKLKPHLQEILDKASSGKI